MMHDTSWLWTIRNMVNLEKLLIDVKMIMALTLVVYFEKVSLLVNSSHFDLFFASVCLLALYPLPFLPLSALHSSGNILV